MMLVDKTSTSKTEQSKQERLGEAIWLHTSNMVVTVETLVNTGCYGCLRLKVHSLIISIL